MRRRRNPHWGASSDHVAPLLVVALLALFAGIACLTILH